MEAETPSVLPNTITKTLTVGSLDIVPVYLLLRTCYRKLRLYNLR